MTADSPAAEREFAYTRADYRILARMIHEKTGICLGERKDQLIYSRLASRLRTLGLRSFKQYREVLANADGEELSICVNAVTTNLTRLFREPHHFDHLRDVVMAEARTSGVPGGGGRFRVWSAGCSSGEEAYSIAMTLLGGPGGFAGWDARILATDLDTTMLERGRAGVYHGENVSAVPDRHREFHRRTRDPADSVEMDERLKAMITFKRLNLLESWPMKGPFNAIFCRNVMIYFDRPTQRSLLARFAKLLPEGGWLYLGHSENVRGLTDLFRMRGKTIYQKVA